MLCDEKAKVEFPHPEKCKRAELLVESAEWDRLRAEHKISTDESGVMCSILGRMPTKAELGVFSSMWSEHCSYKSSRYHLKRLPTEGEQVIVGPGENAGVVQIAGSLCVAFKMESHNHPSYLEPYQGAATGVGGILRDVFCMGARPIANLNSLRFGQKTHRRTPYLFERVIEGIGDYGNCVGVPTVGGSISFHPRYDGNCLVNAMTVGMIHKDRIFKGFASGEGNLVVYVGSATGRDGVRGATMASGSFSGERSESKTTVQVGDPFAEKQLLEATLDMLERQLVVGLQDMGAAGLTSSAFEMADRAGSGLLIDLDKVPVRADNMSAYELLLSESQERMLLCVDPSKWEALEECLAKWELPFAVVGKVTSQGRVQIVYQNRLEVDVPVKPLVSRAPVYQRPMLKAPLDRAKSIQTDLLLGEKIHHAIYLAQDSAADVLSRLLDASGSHAMIYEQYDHHIGVRSVLGPEHGGAAVLSLSSPWLSDQDQKLGLALSVACNERHCAVDAQAGASHAVLKAARSIAATGAQPLAVTDCLNYGNPEDPEIMAQISDGIDGIAEACKALNTPVVSGNVSLYNETDGQSILPTPMIGMVGVHPNIEKAVGGIFKNEDAIVVSLTPRSKSIRWGGSLLAHLYAFEGSLSGMTPELDFETELEAFVLIAKLIAQGQVWACRDVGEGGLLTSLWKMSAGRSVSFRGAVSTALDLKEQMEEYFAEHSSSYILQLRSGESLKMADEFLRTSKNLELRQLGKTMASEKGPFQFELDGRLFPVEKLERSYVHSLLF